MIRHLNLKAFVAFTALFFLTSASATTQTPVQKHGWLTAKKGYLYDEHGKIVQLRGMSFYWSNSDFNGDQWYTAATLDALVDTWKCTVVRLAYNPNADASGGWDRCKIVLNQAIKRGIYVIIDWHSHNAHNEESAAKTFFTSRAQEYKNTPNVIFEPYNEPITTNGNKEDGTQATASVTWKAIKPYLTNICKTIRDQGANNLIVCGTPYYSQFVNVAKTDTIQNKNIAYSFHFYAASHGKNAMYVLSTGKGGQEATYLEGALGQITIFVTEWGTTNSDGSQQVDAANTKWWFDNYVNGDYHLSHCNWSVSDFEGSSAFGSSGPSSTSASGAVVKPLLTTSAPDSYDPPDVIGNEGPAKSTVTTTPGVINAFFYNRYFGASFTNQSVSYSQRDSKDYVKTSRDSMLKVNPGVKDDWVKYNINASSATSNLVFRCLTGTGGGTIDVLVDSTAKTTVQITKKAGWNYVVAPVAVSGGAHTIQFKFTSATDTGYGISWIEFTSVSVRSVPAVFSKNSVSMTVANGCLSVSLPLYHSYTSYELISVNGQVIRSGKISQTVNSLTLRSIPAGMILLRLYGRGEPTVFKTVVN